MRILLLIFKIVISLLLIFDIIYLNFIAFGDTVLYNLISVVFIILIILNIFNKIPKLNLFIILILWIIFNRLPFINKVFDKDTCLDSSICKEGLEINTEYGLIKINKNNCLKYGWIWDEKRKRCNMKYRKNLTNKK